MKTKWYIKHFSDYHEIYSDEYKFVELGCFPVEDYGCWRYFGLFYKGKRPFLKIILSNIKKKVCFNYITHYRTGADISITEKEFMEELKLVLKNK